MKRAVFKFVEIRYSFTFKFATCQDVGLSRRLSVSVFSDLERDTLTIVKQNGTVIKNVRASVQFPTIFITDESVPIEENDRIYRQLPSGIAETFVVVEPGFLSSPFGGMSHYEVKVRRVSSIDRKEFDRVTNIYNVTGTNARVNVGSVDNSVNIASGGDLFADLRTAVGAISDVRVREKSLEAIGALEKAKGSQSFPDRYKDFIQTLANHVAVIAPFLPALTALIR
jgi:hypothetical protein